MSSCWIVLFIVDPPYAPVSETGTTSVSDSRIAAQAGILDAVQAQVGDVSATGLFRVAAQATSAGAESTIGLIAEATSGAKTHSAGMLIDALSNGKSRVAIFGDQFVVIDPEGAFPPFVIEEGKAWFDEGRIRNLTAENITADKLDATEVLQAGTALTEILAYNSVIANDSGILESTNIDPISHGTWTDLEVIDCENPNPSYVLIEYFLSAFVSRSSFLTTGRSTSIRLVRRVGGVDTQLRIVSAVIPDGSGQPNSATSAVGPGAFMIDEGGATDSQYVIQAQCAGLEINSTYTVQGYAKLMWWKR